MNQLERTRLAEECAKLDPKAEKALADLARPAPKSRRRFASAHLLGKFRSHGSSNAAIRAAMKAALTK